MSQYEGRQWMVDLECPWWAKLRRAESLIDEIRHASRRSTEQEWLGDCSLDADEAVVYRIRLIEPISADFAVLVGDAIRNLRSSLNQGCLSAGLAALWSAHRGCRANDEITDPHLRRAVRRLGDFEEQTDEAAPLGGLREAGFRTIRSGQPFAFAERLRRSADDRGRTPLADRRRLRGTTMSASSRLRNVYKHRRLPLLAATLAREGGR